MPAPTPPLPRAARGSSAHVKPGTFARRVLACAAAACGLLLAQASVAAGGAVQAEAASASTLPANATVGGTAQGDDAALAQRLAAAVPKGTRLVVAEQSGEASAAWKLSGLGKDAPYQVTFATFNGGPAVLEALVSGAVDVGYIGEAPIPIAVGAGVKDLVAIAITANPGSPANTYLVVQPNSPVRKVEDLRGKKIAYPAGTGRHMILAGILHGHGMDLRKDVQGVQVPGSEVAPTFSSRAVDAAIVLGHQYFRLGSPPILANGSGHNWGLNPIVARRSALADPAKAAAIADFVRRAVAIYNWQATHADAWIQASYVKLQGLTPAQGKILLDEEGVGAYYPIDGRLTEVFQEIADGLVETGALSRKIDIAPYVDGRYNDIVAAQNRLDGVQLRPLANDRNVDDGSKRPDSKPFVLR
ncbi:MULTISPECIES: PhnD/SsuA/transferrin family substrate-binding protein [unclassified Achromobacter]|uniref:PhnD/SsuA/transferrin family substrate-binding protein n=1 Tax=unclassified Achromobacter TaxID=2626865 RepID=UPI000B515E33|nr:MULTISPECIES: PhnD/SsuA/transferrin family substrate-binding protein [unclassified Achromobacter]OWT68153.1 ABC transporter substrate-binding protein [Achromobacter sp. HZ34]OWT69990.1 ABC transporter substrate-binding protein [Achromobacter sp. HZ28]